MSREQVFQTEQRDGVRSLQGPGKDQQMIQTLWEAIVKASGEVPHNPSSERPVPWALSSWATLTLHCGFIHLRLLVWLDPHRWTSSSCCPEY